MTKMSDERIPRDPPIRWRFYPPERPRWWQIRRWYWYWRKPWKLMSWKLGWAPMSDEEIKKRFPN